MDDLQDVRELVLVVSADCRLCERARELLEGLGLSFREVDLADDEADRLARRGVPVIFFPVLVDGEQVVAYGDISEMELRAALSLGAPA